MRVEVVSTPDARNDLVNLLLARTPGTRADDAARMADVFLADMEVLLIRHQAEPPRVVRVRGRDGGVRWWEYCNGVWVCYTIDDSPSRFLRPAVRTVTIRIVEKEPPWSEPIRSTPE